MPGRGAGFPGLAALEAAVASGALPGLVALVSRGGETSVDAAGHRDIAGQRAMTRDTVFPVASISKPVTAVAALMLVDDGILGLDDPVDPFLPELARPRVIASLDGPLDATVPAERPVTLRDLLTMRFGLGVVFADPAASPLLARLSELGLAPGPALFADDAGTYMSRLGRLPLIHQPGARWLYHTGLDVAGVLVARARGEGLGAFLRRRIFDPLGMRDTGFFHDGGRLATLYQLQGDGFTPANMASGPGFDRPPMFESGGGGLVSTVDDFLRFGRMLLAGGVHEDRRLLSEASLAEMLTDQITPGQKAASPWFPADFWDTHGWGLGTAVITAPAQRAGRFGWWGGYGAAFWCDPASETVALLFTNKLMEGPDDSALAQSFIDRAFENAT